MNPMMAMQLTSTMSSMFGKKKGGGGLGGMGGMGGGLSGTTSSSAKAWGGRNTTGDFIVNGKKSNEPDVIVIASLILGGVLIAKLLK